MTVYRHDAMTAALEAALAAAPATGGEGLSLHVADICRRRYATSQGAYMRRLRMIGFTGKGRVLDAGCGFGQWSFALLAAGNGHVDACDVAPASIGVLAQVCASLGETRIAPQVAGLEALPYADSSVDAIMCYRVLHVPETLPALRELFRVLKPGGTLYATANGFGHYAQRWMEERPCAADHQPRLTLARIMDNTARVESGLAREYPCGIIIESEQMRSFLDQAGFSNAVFAQEGHVNVTGDGTSLPFFPGEYKGMRAVYEFLARK